MPWNTGKESRLAIKFLFAEYIKQTVIYRYIARIDGRFWMLKLYSKDPILFSYQEFPLSLGAGELISLSCYLDIQRII